MPPKSDEIKDTNSFLYCLTFYIPQDPFFQKLFLSSTAKAHKTGAKACCKHDQCYPASKLLLPFCLQASGITQSNWPTRA